MNQPVSPDSIPDEVAFDPAPDFEQTRAPLMEHLLEFRRRLMLAVGVWFAAFLLCYSFADQIYAVLVHPLAEASGDSARQMIYTGMAEAFLTQIKLAMFASFYVAFPVIAAQGYLFLAPGLYKRERRVMLPFLIASPVLFAAGVSLCYFYVMPLAWKFFLGFEQPATGAAGVAIHLEARVSEYLSLSMQLITAFGLAFQLPVLLMLLGRVGIITVEGLVRFRKYALILVFAVAAVLTPPDVASQIALAVPLYALYEMTVWAMRRFPQDVSNSSEAEVV